MIQRPSVLSEWSGGCVCPGPQLHLPPPRLYTMPLNTVLFASSTPVHTPSDHTTVVIIIIIPCTHFCPHQVLSFVQCGPTTRLHQETPNSCLRPHTSLSSTLAYAATTPSFRSSKPENKRLHLPPLTRIRLRSSPPCQ